VLQQSALDICQSILAALHTQQTIPIETLPMPTDEVLKSLENWNLKRAQSSYMENLNQGVQNGIKRIEEESFIAPGEK